MCQQVLCIFIMPAVILIIMIFNDQTKMAELYGIRGNEMAYYLTFACVTIPFSLVMDVFVLNTQEVSAQQEQEGFPFTFGVRTICEDRN